VELFLEILRPPPKLVIVGAVHVAIHLVHFAKRLGFRCVVVDARAAFATPERFSHADELVVEWPSQALAKMPIHDETYCVFLTHDPKLDDPALEVALRRDARYVGALGSKRTHAKRVDSLRNLGLAEDLIARIHAPIGLDLGGRKPEEIALSIAAQLVASRHGKET
jgi:xanthine dehydrogenase accessory factor